jgi:thioesterase domain-containing protein
LDGTRETLGSIEEMASLYIREVRSVQARGPYQLAGFSFGGLVAYEMAQQLISANEDVELLILFDTEAGQQEGTGASASFLRLLIEPSWQHWTRDLPKAIRKKINRTLKGVQAPKLLREVRNANRDAAEKYVLRPYPGEAIFVRAMEKLKGSGDPTTVWRSLVGSLEIQDMASDHFDMLVEPEVDHLASYLKRCIDRAESEAGAGNSFEHRLAEVQR